MGTLTLWNIKLLRNNDSVDAAENKDFLFVSNSNTVNSINRKDPQTTGATAESPSSQKSQKENQSSTIAEFQCKICKQTLSSIDKLRTHLNNVHKLLQPPPVSSSLSMPVFAASRKSPTDDELQADHFGFEPLSPKLEVVDHCFDDVDMEQDLFSSHSVATSSFSSNVGENLSSFPFQCSKCDLQFRTNDLLEIHQSVHDLLVHVKFRCEVSSCFRYFDTAVEYQRHFISDHTKNQNRRWSERLFNGRGREGTIQCKFCCKKSRTKSEALSHEATHSKVFKKSGTKRQLKSNRVSLIGKTVVNSFLCPECPTKVFGTDASLRDHLAQDHNKICPICKKQFKIGDYYGLHILRHRKEGPFPCPVADCYLTYRSAFELRQHSHQRHPSEAQKNGTVLSSRRNDAGPNRFLCSLCPREYETESERKRHEGVVHAEKPFPCPQCDRKYVTRKGRRDHIAKIHSAAKLLTCPQCPGKFFCNKFTLEHHHPTHNALATAKLFSCPHCELFFSSKRGLQMHLPIHSSDHPFVCPTCATAFKREADMKDHMKRHTGIKSYACSATNCSMAFTTSSELQYHRRKKHRDRSQGHTSHAPLVHKCEPCDKRFRSYYNYSMHVKTKHRPKRESNGIAAPTTEDTETEPSRHQPGQISFSCDLCEASFTSRSFWARHKLEHSDNTDILCHFCGGQFPTAEALEGHMKMIHANAKDPRRKRERKICHICGKSLGSRCQIRKHMERHDQAQLICDECGKPFKTGSELKLHKNTHLAEKPFKCKFCPYRYNTPSVVYQHMHHHHTGPGDTGFVESPLSADLERSFPCDADGCSLSFTSLPGLKQHQLYHTGEKNVSCKKCDDKFVTIYDAYAHKAEVHTKKQNQKRFECLYCQKICMYRATLDSHVRYMHTQEEPFPCTAPDCDRKFKTKSDLKYHTVVAHTGEYKFECEVCGKKFATRGNYNTHMRVHTGIRVFRCEEEEGCEASFKAASLLKKHLYKVHGRTDLGAEVIGSWRGRKLLNPMSDE